MADLDWYPNTRAGERLLYSNLNAKIDNYAAKYPMLTVGYLGDIHTFCNLFMECYDKIEYNRATGRQATTWFSEIVDSKQENTPVAPPPVYQAIVLPAGALLGIEKSCRDFAGLLKKQLNYDRADGLDLMLEREKSDDLNLTEAVPDLKLTAIDTAVKVEWKKSGFDALELQYRKADSAMWQAADKSTVNVFDFTPAFTAPGVPEKFEFRAVLLIKNEHVGQWSPTYTLTLG